MNIRIGGVGMQLTADRGLKFACPEKLRDFFSSEPPQAFYRVSAGPAPAKPASAPCFDNEHSWRLYNDGGRWVLWVSLFDRDPYLAGSFSPDFHTGEIFTAKSPLEPGKYVFPIDRPFGEVLMTNLLGAGYGIMLHSCGVVDAGGGLVFAGVSGAGKSTTARLWSGQPAAQVLNDDHVILAKVDGQFRVYGTPWHGQGGMALAADAPLQRLFVISHAPANQAKRLAPARAAAALLVRAFAPLWSAAAMEFTLAFLEELCQAVPCYEYGFLPDYSAVEYARDLPAD